MKFASRALASILAVFVSAAAWAGGWTLDAENSHLAFGSVKKDKVGEVHRFTGLSGSVGEDGAVSISINLNSVDTSIAIRNKRMKEHVFGKVGEANLTASIDTGAVSSLAAGEFTTVPVDGTLSFLGQDIPVTMDMFVARLSDSRVLVTTNDMIFLTTEKMGIDPGIDKLQELAKLPGITRAFPVTVRLVFEAG